MATEFWKTKTFKELNRYWDEKLKESGFEDIETDLQTHKALKQRATNSFRQQCKLERESKLEYYLRVEASLNEDPSFEQLDFFNHVEQLILIKHAEGKEIIEISRELRAIGI